jgi:hypothetical protein
MWENTVLRGRQQMTKWRIRIACWIPQGKRQSEYVIIIVFPLTNAPQCYGIRILPVLFITVKRSSCRCALQEGIRGEQRQNSSYSYPLHRMGASGKVHDTTDIFRGKKNPDRKPTESRNRSGCVWEQKIPCPPGNRTAIAWSSTS